METLLSADVIRAAATSTLGVLSLVCLILGVIALALFREASIGTKVTVFCLLLVSVAGFAFAVLSLSKDDAIDVTAGVGSVGSRAEER